MIQSVEYWEGLQSPKYSGEELWNSGRFLFVFVCLFNRSSLSNGRVSKRPAESGVPSNGYRTGVTAGTSTTEFSLLSTSLFKQSVASNQDNFKTC